MADQSDFERVCEAYWNADRKPAFAWDSQRLDVQEMVRRGMVRRGMAAALREMQKDLRMEFPGPLIIKGYLNALLAQAEDREAVEQPRCATCEHWPRKGPSRRMCAMNRGITANNEWCLKWQRRLEATQ